MLCFLISFILPGRRISSPPKHSLLASSFEMNRSIKSRYLIHSKSAREKCHGKNDSVQKAILHSLPPKLQSERSLPNAVHHNQTIPFDSTSKPCANRIFHPYTPRYPTAKRQPSSIRPQTHLSPLPFPHPHPHSPLISYPSKYPH